MEKYRELKFQHTVMLCNVGGGCWFSTVMEYIYDNMRGLSPNLKYISLTEDEMNALQMCLPLFYPATQKTKSNYAIKMDEKVLHTLKSRM